MSTSTSTPIVSKACGSGIAKRNRRSTASVQPESISSVASTALQRAIQTLEQPSDDWDTFGDFVSVEMRQLNSLDGALAGRLKRQITKSIMNAFDEHEAANLSAIQLPNVGDASNGMQWRIIQDSSLPPGTMQLFDSAGKRIDNYLSMPLENPTTVSTDTVTPTAGISTVNSDSTTVSSIEPSGAVIEEVKPTMRTTRSSKHK